MSSFFSSYTLSFLFREKDLGMSNDVEIAMTEKKEVKIYNDAACDALESEIKENETRKDCNTSTGPIKAEVKNVFFYQ
jgi:hypothetical protein